jgi:N-acetylglucosaminyldiphosphoundecaprenol N-acetyl-beta-D-mannosaminyltransferase
MDASESEAVKTRRFQIMSDGVGRVNVLGVGISPVNMTLATAMIEAWVSAGVTNYVTVTGVHGVMESQDDPQLRDIHNEAGLVVPDGMPMVWLSKLAGVKHADRVYGPDLMLELCRRSGRSGPTHYLYGGAEGVGELLRRRLLERFPELRIVGTYCPPFRPLTVDEEESIAADINDSGADIVWVGLSTPKQERWMHAMRPRLTSAVLIGVGAAFDFHAGLKSQAPRWMQRSGLEWLYRMVSEPKRLSRRYLKNNPRFVWLLALSALGVRRLEMPSKTHRSS